MDWNEKASSNHISISYLISYMYAYGMCTNSVNGAVFAFGFFLLIFCFHYSPVMFDAFEFFSICYGFLILFKFFSFFSWNINIFWLLFIRSFASILYDPFFLYFLSMRPMPVSPSSSCLAHLPFSLCRTHWYDSLIFFSLTFHSNSDTDLNGEDTVTYSNIMLAAQFRRLVIGYTGAQNVCTFNSSIIQQLNGRHTTAAAAIYFSMYNWALLLLSLLLPCALCIFVCAFSILEKWNLFVVYIFVSFPFLPSSVCTALQSV